MYDSDNTQRSALLIATDHAQHQGHPPLWSADKAILLNHDQEHEGSAGYWCERPPCCRYFAVWFRFWNHNMTNCKDSYGYSCLDKVKILPTKQLYNELQSSCRDFIDLWWCGNDKSHSFVNHIVISVKILAFLSPLYCAAFLHFCWSATDQEQTRQHWVWLSPLLLNRDDWFFIDNIDQLRV